MCENSHRQCRVGIVNNRPNRLKGCFRRSSNPHVEVAGRIVAFKKWEIRLLRLLAKAMIAEVGHDADDFDVRLGIRPGTFTDAHA